MTEILKRAVKEVLAKCNIAISRTNRKSELFFEVDGDFNGLYNVALKKTQCENTDNALKRQRQYTLMELLRESRPALDEGNVSECGCWRGLSAYQIASRLKSYGFKNKFFIFDSFEGLSEFGKEDLENNIISDQDKRRREFACSVETVSENLKDFSFIEYKKGWIPSRFGEVERLKFSFVHIDVDLYQPIKDSLEFFYPRMVKGGAIALDDYGYLDFPGAKRAVDEFMRGKKDFVMHLPSGSAFIIVR